jgi:hypothetical protein
MTGKESLEDAFVALAGLEPDPDVPHAGARS